MSHEGDILIMDPLKNLLTDQPERSPIATEDSSSFLVGPRARRHLNDVLQFRYIFNCFGGNWEGQIQLLKTGSLELRIQGLPPVKAGQETPVSVFWSRPEQTFFLSTHQWDYSTRSIPNGVLLCGKEQPILLLSSTHHKELKNFSLISKKDSCHTELGSFVLSQLAAGDPV